MGSDLYYDRIQYNEMHRGDHAKLVAWVGRLVRNNPFAREPREVDYDDLFSYQAAHDLWVIYNEAEKLYKPFEQKAGY